MYGSWYDRVKAKHGEKEKLCYMDRDSFIVHIKTKGIYSDISKYVETRFDTSNYRLDRPLPKGKNKKVTGLMKNELRGKIMKAFAALKAETYSYLTGNSNKDKKV